MGRLDGEARHTRNEWWGMSFIPYCRLISFPGTTPWCGVHTHAMAWSPYPRRRRNGVQRLLLRLVEGVGTFVVEGVLRLVEGVLRLVEG
jgi:hypothetical protein